MIEFNDAYRVLDLHEHKFSDETVQDIIGTAFQTLIKRGYIGLCVVPLLFIVAGCLTEYSNDYPSLFLILLCGFLVCIGARIICAIKQQEQRQLWHTVHFVSSTMIGFLFGIYIASSIYFYEDSWTTTIVLFMLAAIAGASIASYCIWTKLSRMYLTFLIGPTTIISLFFCSPETRIIGSFCCIAWIYNFIQAGLWGKSFWQAHVNVYLLKQEVEKYKASQVDLHREKDNATQANQAKTEFLANMSHELRTPMHGILSYAELGATRIDKLPITKLQNYFHEITDSGNRLMLLLNDLLDLAKLESGKMTYSMAEQDMCETIYLVISEFQATLEKKGVQLKTNLQGKALITVFDADKIAQVLRNLLSNSIKFSETGKEIFIEAMHQQITRNGNSYPVIMVAVNDQGIGISEEDIPTIFDQFIQSSKTKDGAGGTGLGLAICKQIIEAHKGTITVANNDDHGVRVVFTCPILRRRDDL